MLDEINIEAVLDHRRFTTHLLIAGYCLVNEMNSSRKLYIIQKHECTFSEMYKETKNDSLLLKTKFSICDAKKSTEHEAKRLEKKFIKNHDSVV